MKEPLQQSGNEVSIVIYDSPLPPRYIKFSKKFIKTLFIVVPVLVGLIVLGGIAVALNTKLKDTAAPTLPSILTNEESKFLSLEAEIKSLTDSNKQLQDKLSDQSTAGASQDEAFLMGIKKPYGMQNFLSQNKVSLDQFELVQDQNKTSLKFQIISTNPENRVAGHIIVFMISDSGLMAYPLEANEAIGGGIKFAMGETFAVSRLRPTTATFPQSLTGKSARFVIYIFSREGDLLLIKETESYKVGAKS
jgi:hypothetical protein